MDKKVQQDLLVSGYIRLLRKEYSPIEITHLVAVYCPIYHPYCHILFDFDNANKIYVKLAEIAPNLEGVETVKLYLNIRSVNVVYDKQYLSFEKPEEDDEYNDFDYKLIQAGNNGVDFAKWDAFIKKLNSSDVGINGFIKPCGYQQKGTAVAFDKIDHNVLDLIEYEFGGVELFATWSCDDIQQFEWKNSHKTKLSEWRINKLCLSFIQKDINLYFEDNLLCTLPALFEMLIAAEMPKEEMLMESREHFELHITLGSIILSMGSKNEALIDVIKPLLTLFPWHDSNGEKEMEECTNKIRTDGIYTWTEHEDEWKMSKQEYLTLLSIADQIANVTNLTMTTWIWIDIDR